jgi:hypothetical protein
MSTETLAGRMLFLIQATTQEHRRYKELEEKTGVPADRWKAFALGRQRPTAEMIEAIGSKFPNHCEWLLTGQVRSQWQKDPTKRKHPQEKGALDLSVLDDFNPMPVTTDEENILSKLTPNEIAQVVEATVNQLTKKVRSGGDQEG